MEPVGEVRIDFQSDRFSLLQVNKYFMYPAFLFRPSIVTILVE